MNVARQENVERMSGVALKASYSPYNSVRHTNNNL